MFGGLPLILDQKTDEQKRNYLISLFNTTYLKDTIERNNILRVDVLDTLVNLLSSSVGSLTNPKKIADTFTSHRIKDVSINTINTYLNYLLDAFIIEKAERYNVKEKNILKHLINIIFQILDLETLA